jgi:hypothetical protein
MTEQSTDKATQFDHDMARTGKISAIRELHRLLNGGVLETREIANAIYEGYRRHDPEVRDMARVRAAYQKAQERIMELEDLCRRLIREEDRTALEAVLCDQYGLTKETEDS